MLWRVLVELREEDGDFGREVLEELRVLVGLGEQEELTRQQEKRCLVGWMLFFLEITLD